LRTSRIATCTASSLPLGSPPFVRCERVVPERAELVSLVMARDLLEERLGLVAAIGLQLNGQLPVRVEQPPMTRFELSAAPAAAERGQETIDE
jgi:hypothetical protein